MMMRWERALGVLGGSVLVAAGAIELAACSEGGSGFPTKHDASPIETDTGVVADGATNDDGGGSADAGTDAPADCGSPLTLQPSPDAGALCPFMAGGAKQNCAASQHCCVYPVSANTPSTCNAAGAACEASVDAGGADFECDEKSDCVDPSKPTCCLEGTAVLNAACPRNGFVSGMKRTFCSADPTCGGKSVICGTNAECGDSGTCAPLSTKSKTIGACAP